MRWNTQHAQVKRSACTDFVGNDEGKEDFKNIVVSDMGDDICSRNLKQVM